MTNKLRRKPRRPSKRTTVLDLGAERQLADVTLARGTAEVAGIGDRDHVAQLGESYGG